MKKGRKVKRRFKAKQKRKIINIVVAIIIFIILLSIFFFLTPRITLKGKGVMTVNINGEYKEPGYKAVYMGKDITKDVKVEGKVKTKKNGSYEIVYKVKKNLFLAKAKRTVKVSDIEAPKITLTEGESVNICPGSEYQELGYSALDNVDLDITDKVKVKKTKNKITYTVEDKAKNKTEVVRTIKEKDEMAPSITLEGGEIVFAYKNEAYKELGYSALDNCDGDITNKVEVEGKINTSSVKDQELTYKVVDKNGNKTEVKRTVKIVEHNSKGTIYLTFDDGPKSGTTDVILDILKEEGVKATFFVTGTGPDELIKREYDEGHTVALHTYSHNYGTVYASVDSYFQDLKNIHDRVERITGYDSKIIRFPGGSSNTVSRKYQQGIMSTLVNEVVKRGYYYYDWNISSGDAGELKDADCIYQNVIKQLSKSRVNMILMHDIKPYTRDALKRIIQYGKSEGYHFEAITTSTEMVKQRVNN